MYHLVHKIPHKANYEIYFQKCTVSPFWCPYFFFFLLSHYKSQRIQMPPMLCPTGNNINSGRINTAVPQNIRQTGNIFIYRIEAPGKQMAKIMRKYFLCIHPASRHRFFIIFHILLRSKGRPVRVINTGPSTILSRLK